MNAEQFFIKHCTEVLDNMDLGGQEVAEQSGFDLNVKEIVERGRAELKVFIDNELTVDYLLSDEAKDMTPILHTINSAILLVALMDLMSG
jgi:hypothetical protein